MPRSATELTGFERKYLRGLAHGQKPILLVGQKGMTESLAKALAEALESHELVKVKFIDDAAKENKKQLADRLRQAVDAHLVGMIGHTAIFYRAQTDPQKRKVILPRQQPTS